MKSFLIKLQNKGFAVNIAKFLRTPILKSICKRLLLLKILCLLDIIITLSWWHTCQLPSIARGSPAFECLFTPYPLIRFSFVYSVCFEKLYAFVSMNIYTSQLSNLLWYLLIFVLERDSNIFFRSICWRCSVKKVFLKISQISQEKDLCWSLFFNKVVGPLAATIFKERLQHRRFPVKFAKFLRAPILKNICERLILFLYEKILTLQKSASQKLKC